MKAGLFLTSAALFLALGVFAGCYESPRATYHQPGEYMGKSDPLLDKLENPEFRQVLVERFNQVQTDR